MKAWTALALCLCMLPCAPALAAPRYDVEIRRTSFGIPHVKAPDEGSLGYGIGYAYAQDNLCLLAEQVVTANGERSRYFGPDAKYRGRVPNLANDTLHRWLDRGGRTQSAWAEQPATVKALLRGYAAGVNRFLADTPAAQLPAGCAGAPWLRPITALDLVRLSRLYAVALGLGGFAEAFGGARPAAAAGDRPAQRHAGLPHFPGALGSNAVAIGRELGTGGRGMLLGNPHLEWDGPYRFWELHATIPGKLDVMGASLPGYPGVQIGFNRHVAWSHTIDTAAHYVLYRLKLDAADPTRYLVDGKARRMTRVEVPVPVRREDGSVATEVQVVYETEFGPVIAAPDWLPWTRETAYALHDPNVGNHRSLRQWLQMGRARDVAALRRAIESTQGIPWVDTVAVDDRGTALYLDASVIPYIDARMAARCAPDRTGLDVGEQVPVLDGSRSECRPRVDKRTPQPGIFPARLLPALQRYDFVQNSNESAWLTNPARPLEGYSPFVSRAGLPLNGRTRFALERLTGAVASGKPMRLEDMQAMLTDNDVLFARLVLDDLLGLCVQAAPVDLGDGRSIDPGRACGELRAWDRKANLDSGSGYLYFSATLGKLRAGGIPWAVPFDARDPIHTPRGLKADTAQEKTALLPALAQAAAEVEAGGLGRDVRWGDVQFAAVGGREIPMHGGDEALGIYNHIGSAPAPGGRLRVTDGASYVQAVEFTDDGPHAEGFLAYSQSSDPASAHASDQTLRFSLKQWIVLPFTEAQIAADPELAVRRLRR